MTFLWISRAWSGAKSAELYWQPNTSPKFHIFGLEAPFAEFIITMLLV
jgi:hypothetical protein